MKLEIAKRIMSDNEDSIIGYRVCFDQTQGSKLVPDFFPEADEPVIQFLDEAVKLAKGFHNSAGQRYVNISIKRLKHNGTAFPELEVEESFPVLRPYVAS